MTEGFAPMAMSWSEPTDSSRYIHDPAWAMEQKMDGTRAMAVITPTGITWPTNLQGVPLGHTAAIQHFPKIEAHLATILSPDVRDDEIVVVDGEVMIHTGEYRVWDMPVCRHKGVLLSNPDRPLADRRRILNSAAFVWNITDGPVSVITQATTTADKQALWTAIVREGVEGAVVKHLASHYEFGGRTQDWRKLKFVRTADVVVTAVDRPDPRHGSISFAIFDFHNGLDAPEPILEGNCSAIGKPAVEFGDVIEVAYLYCTGTSLVQPRMIRTRPDKEPEQCGMDQFPAYTRKVVQS